ncbi:hypothetical protein PPROV_000113200 [Pycnococcus provasolii]|uniref:Uncharacterized protein n=1 Tax=Pycnococcus provasolii TaxID=41880 RepID=A0A830H5B5_9CHLO|nr:hypothetical protein PPROV_000113200 [Pycnococcus provasolii]
MGVVMGVRVSLPVCCSAGCGSSRVSGAFPLQFRLSPYSSVRLSGARHRHNSSYGKGASRCLATSGNGESSSFKQMLSAEQILEIPIERRRRTTAEECPFCADAPIKENDSRCLGICRLPTNVSNPPQYFPHELQDCADAVNLQLKAMRDINDPRKDHGVQVLYEFAVDAGTMERSRYFGFSSDMYHYDHFQGKALNHMNGLVSCQSWEIEEEFVRDDGRTQCHVKVLDKAGKERFFIFIMVVRSFGKWENCWNTHRLFEAEDAEYNSKYLQFV